MKAGAGVRADRLSTLARRATRRTTRPAQWRSIRCPSGRRKIGPSSRSSMARSMARAVRGASGLVTILPPLRSTVRCGVHARSHVRRCRLQGFGDPQPPSREQRDQRVLARCAESGRDEQGADLVAVQADGVRLVVQSRAADVDGVATDLPPSAPRPRSLQPRRGAPERELAGERRSNANLQARAGAGGTPITTPVKCVLDVYAERGRQSAALPVLHSPSSVESLADKVGVAGVPGGLLY
jgi:hypothetical protein